MWTSQHSPAFNQYHTTLQLYQFAPYSIFAFAIIHGQGQLERKRLPPLKNIKYFCSILTFLQDFAAEGLGTVVLLRVQARLIVVATCVVRLYISTVRVYPWVTLEAVNWSLVVIYKLTSHIYKVKHILIMIYSY